MILMPIAGRRVLKSHSGYHEMLGISVVTFHHSIKCLQVSEHAYSKLVKLVELLSLTSIDPLRGDGEARSDASQHTSYHRDRSDLGCEH